jgi:hypothetical protein
MKWWKDERKRKWKIVSNEDKEITKKIKNNRNKATHSPYFQKE